MLLFRDKLLSIKKAQAAAIPYRRNAARELEILLVTSRRKGRWVLPKGTVRGMLPHASAAREAFEEAGALGVISRNAIGTYHQRKKANGGEEISTPVRAFPLFVNTLLTSWPEMSYRQRRWMLVHEAADAVTNTEMRNVIRDFAQAYWHGDPAGR